MYSKLLTTDDREALKSLLLGLPKEDLAMRFCGPVGSEWLERYVGKIDFEKGVVRGVFDKDHALIAISELAGATDGAMEFAVVVHPKIRGRGIAGKLLTLAKEDAVALGAKELVVYCLGANVAMARIARSGGIALRGQHGDMEGRLALQAA